MLHDALHRPTYFLSPQHEDSLSKEPKQALIIWQRLMTGARKQESDGQISSAITIYGSALEVAKLIFIAKPHKKQANRFIRTSIELIYLIRQHAYPCDLPLLVDTLEGILKSALGAHYSRHLLQPSIDVAFAPIADVRRWMTLLYAIQAPAQTIH